MPSFFVASQGACEGSNCAQSFSWRSALRRISGLALFSRPRSISASKALWVPLAPLVLSACGSLSGGGPPPQKEPARLEIAIQANRDLNLDLKGRGAPLLLRVYELKSDVAFQDADFFALQNTDKAILGPDLLAVDQFVVRPGETREIKRKSNPETTVIGVFAGYRDLPNSVWRVVHKMPAAPNSSWYRAVIPSNQAKLRIDLQSNAILLTDEKAGKRPVQFANESMKGLDQELTESAKEATEVSPKLENGAIKLPEKPTSTGIGKAAAEGAKKLILPK